MTLTSLAAPSGAVRLSDWGVIVARGTDAASFLHSQLTQNMQSLPPDRARLAGYCSPKGRLLATFVAWRPQPADSVALACSADLLQPTLKRLSMFVMRAQCKLSDASADRAVWGLAGAEVGQWLGPEAAAAKVWTCGMRADTPEARWVRLPDGAGTPRWLWLAGADQSPPALPELAADAWAWLEVCSAVPRVVAATSDHFVPQMVNFELVGGVDFQKGCYPGQEVVARSQYRGTLKRRMVLMHATAPVEPGADVFHTGDPQQPAGQVVLAAPAPGGGTSALVEIKLALRGQVKEDLKFTCASAELREEDLPYSLPAEAS